jgi:hypothetical protein
MSAARRFHATAAVAGAGLALLLLLPSSATAQRRYHGAQYRYWDFSDGNDLRDVLYYAVPGDWHIQLEYWDFILGDDQFRPEVGVHLRDQRRSVYTVQYRLEYHLDSPDFTQHRFWLGTDQVLSDHLVGRVEVGTIVHQSATPDDVAMAGFDYYWGSWNFASAAAVYDSRDGGLWTYPMRVRLANEANDWLQFTVAPAEERTLGWAVDAKKSWLRLGLEANDRYDFTNRNNLIFTVGFELPLGRTE